MHERHGAPGPWSGLSKWFLSTLSKFVKSPRGGLLMETGGGRCVFRSFLRGPRNLPSGPSDAVLTL